MRAQVRAGMMLLLAVAFTCPLTAQTLPLRRELPAPVPGGCPAEMPPLATSAVDRDESARLAAEASNAAILGDVRSARDLLARAVALDLTDPDIAFRYARALETLGDSVAAVGEYCRYLRVAGDPPDAEEVMATVRRIAPPVRPGVPESAIQSFHAGLAHADSARFEQADRAFSDVVASAPGWANAWYNRGLVRAELRDRDGARLDLVRFLEFTTDTTARATVLEWIAQIDRRGGYSAGTAFAAGLVPGVGHFYTGRPVMGALVLATAGGAVAAGFLSERRHVECLGSPQDGVCPPAQVRNERVERPYLMVGVGVAAAATLLGAIDAARGAGSRNEDQPVIIFGNGVGRARLVPPQLQYSSSRVDFALLRLRF